MSKAKIIVDARVYIPNAHMKGRLPKGKSSCGVLVIDERGEEFEFKKYLGEMTVPEAEFRGLIFALDQAVSAVRYEVEVWMDSKLVINWMKGEYRLKKEHIRPLFDEAKKYEQRFRKVDYFHHLNTSILGKKAHKLAEEAYKDNQL